MDLVIKIGLWYILIGTILTAIYDWLQQKVVKKEDLIFTNWERILLITGWPILMIISILKTVRDSKDE